MGITLPENEEGFVMQDENSGFIGFEEALKIVHETIAPGGLEEVGLMHTAGRVAGERVISRASSPTTSVSRKDGYAVRSQDLVNAAESAPALLSVSGRAFAGDLEKVKVAAMRAVQITSGAMLPEGADAVVASEFCTLNDEDEIIVPQPVREGQNLLLKGEDVRDGDLLLQPGDLMGGGDAGLLAAGGISTVRVYKRPRVAILGIGDELILPGESVVEGQVFASNMILIHAWLNEFGLPAITEICGDQPEAISIALERLHREADIVLTTGGAWDSERDHTLQSFSNLGGRLLFQKVRIGPGKGVALGVLGGIPTFCLPGGPPSCEMSFLQFALPGILRQAGWSSEAFPFVDARLGHNMKGRGEGWRQIYHGHLKQAEDGALLVQRCRKGPRMLNMARGHALIHLTEDRSYEEGELVPVQCLRGLRQAGYADEPSP